MKIFKYLSLILVLSFTACEEKDTSSFQINGTISGAPNANILIETMSFPNMNGQPSFIIIDTTTSDENGHFVLKGNLNERSIARVKLTAQPENYALLNIFDETIDLNLTKGDPEGQKITGSKATEILNSFIKGLRTRNQEIVDFDSQVLGQSEVLGDSLTRIMEERMDGMIDQYYDFVINFADTTSITTNKIVALENLIYEIHFDKIEPVAEKIIASADTSDIYVRELADKVARYKQVNAASTGGGLKGKPFKDFALKDPDGNSLQLSDLKGQVVLLDFWASWCRPCRLENPNLVKVYNQYKSEGFVIYSVSLDEDATAWVNAVQNDGLSWPWHVSQIGETGNTPAAQYDVRAIPASFLIDKNGIIVEQNLRGLELENAVAKLIKE